MPTETKESEDNADCRMPTNILSTYIYIFINKVLSDMKQLGGNRDDNTTTIAIWKSTKDKLDKNRAPGQCYNGFICQLVDLWERTREEKIPSQLSSVDRYVET